MAGGEQHNFSPAEPRSALTAPTAPAERHDIIDIIRGFALFGILLANMAWTTQFVGLTWDQMQDLPPKVLNGIVGFLALSLVDYKFYTLFSMLFGLGFALQLSRARSRQSSIVPTYIRRLAILLVMGIIHATLIWFGDILHLYAIVGLVLLLFRNLSDRAILRWAIGIMLLTTVGLPLVQFLGGLGLEPLTPEMWKAEYEAGTELTLQRQDAMLNGGYFGVLWVNFSVGVKEYSAISIGLNSIFLMYLNVLWKFLLGMYIGRRMILQNARQHLPAIIVIMVIALAIGITGNVLHTAFLFLTDIWIPESKSFPVLLWPLVELCILALSIGYACTLIVLHESGVPIVRKTVGLLAPVGRMALTNYLTHSVLIVLIFYGVGLGLLGRVGYAGCLLISLGIFGLQIPLSILWLQRFRFGPMEWLWRSLTYGRLQPMRMQSSPSTDAAR